VLFLLIGKDVMLTNNVADIRQEFIRMLKDKEFVIDKSGVKLLEIRGANFHANELKIFGEYNEDYLKRELDWYDSQSLNVNDIPGGPPTIWKQVASTRGRINSNYGWCIYSQENWRQYDNVLQELIKQPTSRRASMIYTRPRMWHDYNTEGMNDFMCTNAVQYAIRDNMLHAYIQMRSNDAVFGYKNDVVWQWEVLARLEADLIKSGMTDVKTGGVFWNASSLHVYERHFHLVV